MRLPVLVKCVCLSALCGCGEGTLTSTEPDDSSAGAGRRLDTPPREVSFHLVFVHGVQSSDATRLGADGALASLEGYLSEQLAQYSATYPLAHPEVVLRYQTYRVNLYTDASGALLAPGIDDVSDGTGVPSADQWRAQLALKLQLALPDDAQNVVLIGHSTGARVSMEVAANVGGAGTVGAHDWGWQARIAGVVTVNGMVDALQKSDYNFIGPVSYLTGCKVGQGKGWCEYSGLVSGVAAASWVARNKRALMLISSGACSPALWTGDSDQALPLRAEGVPAAFGMVTTPVPGKTYGPAHGVHYGAYCHSDITHPDSPRHSGARAAVGDRILSWLFSSAPRVLTPDGLRFDTAPLASYQWSPLYLGGAACPDGEVDQGAPDVVGTCVHPGFFDGDDHPMVPATNSIEVHDGDCSGAARWLHKHSGSQPGHLWMKLYSQPVGGGLISTMR
jgi:hypothetical protein